MIAFAWEIKICAFHAEFKIYFSLRPVAVLFFIAFYVTLLIVSVVQCQPTCFYERRRKKGKEGQQDPS